MKEECEVFLGNSIDVRVRYAFDSRSGNNHALILGISGSGKSTQLESMESDVINHGKKVIELDFSDSSCSKTFLAAQTHSIDVRSNSVVSPLAKRSNVYGQPEDSIDFSKRVTDLLSGALCFKSRQRSLLYEAVKMAAEGCDHITFLDILEWLSLSDTSAASVSTKLQYLADVNIFGNHTTGGWQKLFQHPKPIQVLSLSGFPPAERKVVAELLLDDLHNFLTECGPGRNDFILVLDECQNLRLTSDMPTAFLLSQGRKYGCGVWLATQSPDYFKRDELAQLYQPALVLNFQPNVVERQKICRRLAKNEKEKAALLDMFEQLGRGQFVASGHFIKTSGALSEYGHLLVDNVYGS